jgi:aarF domain-containing kinase
MSASYLSQPFILSFVDSDQKTRNAIGKSLMELTLREMFEWRFVQTDPNPSNFVWDNKLKRLGCLDFGATHEYRK